MKVMTYGGSANDAADGSLPVELFISHSLKYLLDELHFFLETTAVMISPLVRLQSENILPEWLDILFVERIFQVLQIERTLLGMQTYEKLLCMYLNVGFLNTVLRMTLKRDIFLYYL